MSYRLNAAVGPFELLRQVAPASVVPLRQRMGLVPLLAGGEPADDSARVWSRSSMIGHVEADFFGGDGYQTASLWRDGQRIWGPSHATEFPVELRHEWPINTVLARLGVVLPERDVKPAHYDLFAAVGLGVEGDLEGWRRRAAEARRHPTYEAWLAAREAEERAAAGRVRRARLAGLPLPLGGSEVMRILGVPAGPQVGEAIRFLQELRDERGELSHEDAVAALRSWSAR